MNIVIVGDGKVGLALTQMLCGDEHDVTVIDNDEKALERMQETCDAMGIQGHGASRSVLLEAGTPDADLLIAATSSDEINLLSCLMANKMGCRSTIARVRNPEYAEELSFLQEELGLSFTINPEEACSREIYNLLQFPSLLARDQFAGGRVEIVRFRVGPSSPLIGVPLTGLYSIAKVRVIVCAVDRGGTVTIPHGSFVLQEGDDLFVTAASETLSALVNHLRLGHHKIEHVTIVGVSRTGLYLANRLLQSGVGVKLIEVDPQRCQELAEWLPEADVVEGDGTDQEILLAEGVQHSDALVSLIGIDEENIVLSMYAKKLGINTVIPKCNRSQYADMLRGMGIDTPVSPKITSAREIVSYVQAMQNSADSEMISIHDIADGEAYALEFQAKAGTPIVGVPLAELPLKDGVLIACITRGANTIFPAGGTSILPGDMVIAVAATREYQTPGDLLKGGLFS